MAVNYSTAVKNTRMTAVRDATDAGPAAGTLEICTTGYTTVLATITLNDPSGTVTSGVLTFSGTPINTTAGNNGTAALARLRDSTGTVVCDGLTVGTSGADIIVSTTSFTSGLSVSLTSATITHG
jgi:hypothetical protein